MTNHGIIPGPSSQPNSDETLANPDFDDQTGSEPSSSDSDSDSSSSKSGSEEPEDREHDDDAGFETSWICDIPERHRGIAGALTALTQHWIKYLMTAEERAQMVVKEFGEKADLVVEELKGLHNEDYNAFVDRYNGELMEVRQVCGAAEGELRRLMGTWGEMRVIKEEEEMQKRKYGILRERLEELRKGCEQTN